jgi:flagellar biosynthesis protein FlhB
VAESDAEKTEQATDRQIERFREDGKVAQSKELVSAVGLVAGVYLLAAVSGDFFDGITGVLHFTRQRMLETELTHEGVVSLTLTVLRSIGPPLLAVLTGASVVTVATGMAATGFNVSLKAIEPKFSALDPIAAAKQAWGSSLPWIALGKGLAISGVLAWATWGCIDEHVDSIPALASAPPRTQLEFVALLLDDFIRRTLPLTVGIGAADYMWQRFKLDRDMRMDKQEVKDEHKEQEGDPHIRQKRRARQRQLAMGNMLGKVKTAQVVITNPTHYAIALRYKREENAAPIVVARGVDHLALRIRAEAARHEIPIIENRLLARALYAQARAGHPIPAELYGPVAQVLAIVFRQRRGAARAP